MAIITFDTLKFAETLKASGMPEAQAKAQVEALTEAMQDNFHELATRRDLNEAEARMESKIDKLEATFNGEVLLLKWMMTFVLAGIATLIIKSFF